MPAHPRHPGTKDGYEWLRRFDSHHLRNWPLIRRILLLYYAPWSCETARHGSIYRMLGVHRFGRYLPTGGIALFWHLLHHHGEGPVPAATGQVVLAFRCIAEHLPGRTLFRLRLPDQ